MRSERLLQKPPHLDLTAFNQLVGVHQGTAFNLAYRLLGDWQSAETALHHSILLVYQCVVEASDSDFLCVLLRAVAHTCRELQAESVTKPGTAADRIQQGLNQLPFEQRLVVSLADICTLSSPEIGVVIGGSEKAVQQMLSQARLSLRSLWFGPVGVAKKTSRLPIEQQPYTVGVQLAHR